MTEQSFILTVVEALEKHRVNYCIVGGIAVSLHGAIRGTIDVDTLIEHSLAQFELCEKALKSIGLIPRLPLTPKELFTFREEYIKNRNLIAWSFVNPQNPLQVVDVIMTEDAKTVEIHKSKIYGKNFRLISVKNLIKMKQKSGRPQDLEDIKALKIILNRGHLED